jgi:hypothetical protein
MVARIEISSAMIGKVGDTQPVFFSPLKSSLSKLLCIVPLAAALHHQEHGEVRGERLSAKLPHH